MCEDTGIPKKEEGGAEVRPCSMLLLTQETDKL